MSTTPLVTHKIYGSPLISLNYAIDIHSLPSDIWPWLVQVGYHRAGWYIEAGGILRGIKRRVEGADIHQSISAD